jgi:hypothetical protein
MSKMGSEFIRTADERASNDADEVAWLREENARLEKVIADAALLLDEGDPLHVLREMEEDLREAWIDDESDNLDDEADDLAELVATLARVKALLAT